LGSLRGLGRATRTARVKARRIERPAPEVTSPMSRRPESTNGLLAPGPVAVQLRLLPDDWSLDEHTRRVGRQGVAQARAILRRSRRSRD
jgi:hypothetical protein